MPDGQLLTADEIHRQNAMFHGMASKLAVQEGFMDDEAKDIELDDPIHQFQLPEDYHQQPQLSSNLCTSPTPPVFTLNLNVSSPTPAVPPFTSDSLHPSELYTVTDQRSRGLPAPSQRHAHQNTPQAHPHASHGQVHRHTRPPPNTRHSLPAPQLQDDFFHPAMRYHHDFGHEMVQPQAHLYGVTRGDNTASTQHRYTYLLSLENDNIDDFLYNRQTHGQPLIYVSHLSVTGSIMFRTSKLDVLSKIK